MNFDNHNNNEDMFEDYMVYKMSTEDTPSSSVRHDYSGAKKKSGSIFGAVIGAILFLLLLSFIIEAFEPRCAEPGCSNEVSSEGDYCTIHRMQHSLCFRLSPSAMSAGAS